ncbi:gamma-glutamyl-gamma-aminobutyrate hydrolase [Massilia sp. Root418]|jgi:putative glutamine amidotransferase|uniref:gamma-glutamyl-gamma-aminobutyrate hydrolase family protein n=1 Tax=Massilia sp. Root418 TaxID=1736532 RepID=UPI0006FAE021|nr:gamma-glutamyl-gamma-aminobutyrate hydrolase family protein [Massilia sp. Root418]KQW89147.1 gamma-glutamyl-gamma-aminobutyrate hydrolase [Massilia sp. Root418]
MRRPIVIVPACTRHIGTHPDHAVHSKYIDAVVQGAGCMPLILPALGEQTDFEAVLSAADGIMLTGSASNLQAILYGQEVLNLELPQDHARDATTLPLIRAALKRGIPLLAICRGFQELNVALGGSLHQAVQEVSGMMDHRDLPDDPLEKQYGPAHRVHIAPGGKLAHILDGAREIMVNSLHGQGVDRLAPGLVAEATADDGLVEACTVATAPGFTLAVQWHPEWQAAANQDSMKMFKAFGQACRSYQERIP